MARPKLIDRDRRTCWLKLRANDAERDAIEARRRAAGLSLSEYLRRQALDGAIIQRTPMADRDLIRSFTALGNNLNQIARKANTTGELRPDLQDRLEEALETLDQLVEELIR